MTVGIAPCSDCFGRVTPSQGRFGIGVAKINLLNFHVHYIIIATHTHTLSISLTEEGMFEGEESIVSPHEVNQAELRVVHTDAYLDSLNVSLAYNK